MNQNQLAGKTLMCLYTLYGRLFITPRVLDNSCWEFKLNNRPLQLSYPILDLNETSELIKDTVTKMQTYLIPLAHPTLPHNDPLVDINHGLTKLYKEIEEIRNQFSNINIIKKKK